MTYAFIHALLFTYTFACVYTYIPSYYTYFYRDISTHTQTHKAILTNTQLSVPIIASCFWESYGQINKVGSWNMSVS